MCLCPPSFRPVAPSPRKRSARSAAGFTLTELIIVMFLMGVISTVLIAIATQSAGLVSQGAAVAELNQKARGAVAKMAPYIATAIATQSAPALLNPPAKEFAATTLPSATDPDDLVAYQEILFNTTEDFLADDYEANPENEEDRWKPEDGTRLYQFFFELDPGATFQPETGPPVPLGRISLRRMVDASTPDTTVTPRVIAHRVQLFRCYALGTNAVEVVA